MSRQHDDVFPKVATWLVWRFTFKIPLRLLALPKAPSTNTFSLKKMHLFRSVFAFRGFWKRFPKKRCVSNENTLVWTGDFKNRLSDVKKKKLSNNIVPSPHRKITSVSFSKRFCVLMWTGENNVKTLGVDVKLLLRFQWNENGGFWKRISVDVA